MVKDLNAHASSRSDHIGCIGVGVDAFIRTRPIVRKIGHACILFYERVAREIFAFHFHAIKIRLSRFGLRRFGRAQKGDGSKSDGTERLEGLIKQD